MNLFSKVLICILLMSSCSVQPQKKENIEKEDLKAKEWLQGTWIDDMTETPLFTAKGDTIYYNDESAVPVTFKIINDTLKTYGQKIANYHIKKQGESFIWIQSVMGDVLQLSKIDQSLDSHWAVQQSQEVTTEKVIQKDQIVHYNNRRFRGYVYINPTNIKVYQPEITEEGLEIENVYYDNIIHICVYEGKNSKNKLVEDGVVIRAKNVKADEATQKALGTANNLDIKAFNGKLYVFVKGLKGNGIGDGAWKEVKKVTAASVGGGKDGKENAKLMYDILLDYYS